MTEPKRVAYTQEMDLALLEEVVLSNPFQDGVTWEAVFSKLKKNSPRLFHCVKSPKSVRDRTLLKITERKRHLSTEMNASGIEVPDLTQEDKILDEIVMLKEEADRARAEKQRKKKEDPATAIREAAMKRLSKSPTNPVAATTTAAATPSTPGLAAPLGKGSDEEASDDSSGDSGSTPEPRTRRRSKTDLTTLWKERDEREEKNRKEEGAERRRIQEATIKLREEELQMKRQAEEEERNLKRRRLEFEMREREEERKEREKERKDKADERELRRLELDNQRLMFERMMEVFMNAAKK